MDWIDQSLFDYNLFFCGMAKMADERIWSVMAPFLGEQRGNAMIGAENEWNE